MSVAIIQESGHANSRPLRNSWGLGLPAWAYTTAAPAEPSEQRFVDRHDGTTVEPGDDNGGHRHGGHGSDD